VPIISQPTVIKSFEKAANEARKSGLLSKPTSELIGPSPYININEI
jgi:hypothetical protein